MNCNRQYCKRNNNNDVYLNSKLKFNFKYNLKNIKKNDNNFFRILRTINRNKI